MNHEFSSTILECRYYDVRTNYAWHIVLGYREELRKEFFTIPDLGSFEVMSQILNKLDYSIDEFIDLCDTLPELRNLWCQYDEQTHCLTVRSRTFTFNYYTESWAMDWEVDAEICQAIKLKNPGWLRQPKWGMLFHPAKLAELDENLYFRYELRQKIKSWVNTPQYKADCQLLTEIAVFVEEVSPDYQFYVNVNEKLLNVILEGNDRLRIGMVKSHTPKEMQDLPSFLREDWKEGVMQALEGQKTEYEKKVNDRHEKYESSIRELTDLVTQRAKADTTVILNRFRNSTSPYSYADLLFSEVLGGPIPPQSLYCWKPEGIMWSERRSIDDIIADIDSSPFEKFYYKAEKDKIRIKMQYFVLEYEENGPSAVMRLKEKARKLLGLEPTIEIYPSENNTGLDIYSIKSVDANIASAIRYLPKAQKYRKQATHPKMLAAFETLTQTLGPIVASIHPEGYLAQNYEFSFEAYHGNKIEISLYIEGKFHGARFKIEDFDSEFRVWWHTLLLQEVKRMKDISLHPEEAFLKSDDLPF